MDHETFAQLLGNYGQFVGAIAVVVTLGYLAIQVRHSRQATEANMQIAQQNQTLAIAPNNIARVELITQHVRSVALGQLACIPRIKR